MTEPVFEITKAAAFDAAHHIAQGPEGGGYRRLHGHSFAVEATVRGPMQAADWVVDLGALDSALKREAAALDHTYLNDTPGLESPTLERLCLWFADRLRGEFPGLARIVVSRPTAGERCALEI